MNNKIELLDTPLLLDAKFEDFQYWKRTLATEVGWHYPLDIVWILKQIDKIVLPKGATIIDAGGGYGLLQFILASQGYNVISVDYTKRNPPLMHRTLYEFRMAGNQKVESVYKKHLEKIGRSLTLNEKFVILLSRLKNWKIHNYLKEVIKGKEGRGVITFYQSDFSNLSDMKANSVDAVVSVSAIEHSPTLYKAKKSIQELERVLKKGGFMFITTSSSTDTWFHKPSEGWCFSKEDIVKLFAIKNDTKKYKNFEKVLKNIRESNYLKENMPRYYYYMENCGMPHGKYDPKYIPSGIIKIKKG